MAAWLTTTEVMRVLDLSASDDLLTQATDAAEAWVEQRRYDLDLPTEATADLRHGAAMYAARLYLQRGAVSGVPEYDSTTTFSQVGGMSDIYRLVGMPVGGMA